MLFVCRMVLKFGELDSFLSHLGLGCRAGLKSGGFVCYGRKEEQEERLNEPIKTQFSPPQEKEVFCLFPPKGKS